MVSGDGGQAANREAKVNDSEFEMRSDNPNVRAVAEAMVTAADAKLAELKLEPPFDHITLAMALAALVWESGGRHERIAISAIKLLLNMAIDHGIAEQVGLIQMPGPGETIKSTCPIPRRASPDCTSPIAAIRSRRSSRG